MSRRLPAFPGGIQGRAAAVCPVRSFMMWMKVPPMRLMIELVTTVAMISRRSRCFAICSW